jgi:hypothetical protein
MKKYNEKIAKSTAPIKKNTKNQVVQPRSNSKNQIIYKESKPSISAKEETATISSNQEVLIKSKENEDYNNIKMNPFFSITSGMKTSSLDLSKTVFKTDVIPIRLSSNFEKNCDTEVINYFNDEIESSEEDEKGDELIYNDKIKIVKLLDKGAQGKIYLGEIEDLKIPVAVKRYIVENFEQNIVENIIRETEIVKNMEHENIIKYYALECSLIDKNVTTLVI